MLIFQGVAFSLGMVFASDMLLNFPPNRRHLRSSKSNIAHAEGGNMA